VTPYLFFVTGRVSGEDLYILKCKCDASAREQAKALSDRVDDPVRVEVWDETRFVGAAGAALAAVA
jgi:hypothetical protein